MPLHGGGNIIDAGQIVESLIDGLVSAADKLVKAVFGFFASQLTQIIEDLVGPVLNLILFVPAPRPVGAYFVSPTNAPWPEIFNYMFGVTIPLGFTLLLISWQVGQAGSALNAISVKKTREIDRGLFVGVFLIPASYVLGAMYLQIIQYMTKYISPTPNAVATQIVGLLDPSQIENASVVILAWLIGSTVVFLILGALVLNVIRVVFLMLVTILLPVLLGLKLGGIPYFDDWADKFIGIYVSLGLASIIMAGGFRLSVILFSGGGLNITGVPASEFIDPVFGAVPFLLGIIIPAAAIQNGLNLQSFSGLAAAGGAAAGAASQTKDKSKSIAGTAAGRAAKTGPAQKAAGRLKEEYSSKRTFGPDENELEMNADAVSDSVGGTDGPQTQSGLPEPMDGGLPDGPGRDAEAAEADADFVSADDLGGSEGVDDGASDPINRVSAQGDGVTPPQGSISTGSGALGAGSGATSSGSGAATPSSGSGESATSSGGSTRTTPAALNENPGDVPEGEQVGMGRVRYEDPDQAPVDTAWDSPVLTDSDNNVIPVDEEGFDTGLEHGNTYDIEGLDLEKHDIDEGGPYGGDPDDLDAPGVSEDGEYVGVSVTEDTDFEKQIGQTYTENLAGRSKRRVKGGVGSKAESVAERGKNAKKRAKDKHTVDKSDVKSAASKTKEAFKKASGVNLAGRTAGKAKSKAKNSVVERADESLLTEEARKDLGKTDDNPTGDD